jgi:diguanylate cyclase
VMMDVDHFKRVNDEHGHAVGDLVLARLARLLMASTRTSDLLARIGGEEFIAVLVGTPIELAHDICERVRTMVEKHPWEDISAGLHVTISLGLVEVSDPVETPRLMALADKALYAAKNQGRNRVVRSV